MSLAIRFRPSPNHGERRGDGIIRFLVLHYTGMQTAEAALDLLCDPASEVSCHYVVEEDGRIWQLVGEDRRAWHSGISCWRGERDINSHSIGVEIVNPGHEWGYRAFPDRQIEAVTELCAGVVRRHGIAPNNVVAHSDIAPARKIDPGELFPWERLAKAGVGLHVPPVPCRPGPVYERGVTGPPVAALQVLLADFGFDIMPSGQFDEVTELAVKAFQRHFRPEKIDGRADFSTLQTLRALRAMV